jgi:hypothetical protein
MVAQITENGAECGVWGVGVLVEFPHSPIPPFPPFPLSPIPKFFRELPNIPFILNPIFGKGKIRQSREL